MTEPTHAYVATLPCGCVVGITVDNPDHRDDVVAFVQSEMAKGSDVTRMPIEEARASAALMFTDCPHEKDEADADTPP